MVLNLLIYIYYISKILNLNILFYYKVKVKNIITLGFKLIIQIFKLLLYWQK